MLKKLFIIAGIAIIGFVSCTGRVAARKNPADEVSVRGAVVTAVIPMDSGEYLIEVQDSLRQDWGLYDTGDCWEVGDIACMVMDRMGTDDINDDRPVRIDYSGYRIEK